MLVCIVLAKKHPTMVIVDVGLERIDGVVSTSLYKRMYGHWIFGADPPQKKPLALNARGSKSCKFQNLSGGFKCFFQLGQRIHLDLADTFARHVVDARQFFQGGDFIAFCELAS